jgi:hypothetical protein
MGSIRNHRVALLLTLLSVAIGMGWSMLFIPLLKDLHQWWISPDVWVPLQGAHYVANGALGYVYESSPFLVTLPGLPILLAPLAAAGEWLHLEESRPIVLAYPSMWLVYGPFGLGMSAIVFVGARSAYFALADASHPDRVRVLQFALVFLVVVPTAVIYGHYEDVIATGLVVLSVAAIARGRDLKAGFLLAAAILFKQWALLGVLPLLAYCKPGHRLRFAVAALTPPAVMSAFLLLVDWEHASKALFAAPSYLSLGHPAPWVSGLAGTMVSTPFRILALLPAAFAARRVNPGSRPEILAAALAVAFIGRQLFEPLAFAYYLAPGLAFIALHELLSRGRCMRTILLGATLLLWFPLHPEPALWWGVATVVFLLLMWPVVKTISRRDLNDNVRHAIRARLESA